MRYTLILGIILVVAWGIYWTLVRVTPPGPEEIKPVLAPSLLLKDYDGKEINLSDFRGKNVVINSWAAWCPFCVEELPNFTTLQQELGDKIVVVAIDRQETPEKAKEFSDKYGVTGKIILLLDPEDSFYQSIGGFSMPETIFVDKEGFVKEHKRGPMKLEEMRRRTTQTFNL